MFVLDKPFLPRLTFVRKAGAYLRKEQLICTSLGQAPGLSYNHWTILERPDRDKHSSLLQKFVITALKSFITMGSTGVNAKNLSFFLDDGGLK